MGQKVNYSMFTKSLGISFNTLKDYLWFAQKTFVIKKLTPFFGNNARREIVKAPVFYFRDLGLRNFALDRFELLPPHDSGLVFKDFHGFLFENFVFCTLLDVTKTGPSDLHYWRTEDGAEVDFIISRGLDRVPLEVKYQRLSGVTLGKSLHSFIEAYKPSRAIVVNLDFEGTWEVGETSVEIMPFYRLGFGSLQ